MKIFKTLAIAMAMIVGFSACSKDDNKGGNDGKESSLIVYLPKGTVFGTRAVEAPITSPATETNLSNAVVYLLNNHSVVKIETITPAEIDAGYKRFEQVPASVNSVAIVANIPAANLTALQNATSIKTVDDFAKYPYDITSQSTTGVYGKVLMGMANVDDATDPAPDGHKYKEADVELDALTARFEFNGQLTPGNGVQEVKLEGVWINNFPMTYAANTLTLHLSNSSLWGINPSADIVGSSTPVVTVPIIIPSYSPAEYHEAYNSTVDGQVGSPVYAFQLFAGDYVPHLILLVSGKYDNGEYFLAWLTYNYFTDNDEVGNPRIGKVEGNKIYKISGAVTHAKDFTEIPEVDPFDLGLNCVVTDWTDKNITPGIE